VVWVFFTLILSCNYTITADVHLPSSGANGVIITQAGRFGGWSLHMKNGRLMHEYNYFGMKEQK
jgi:arylsulfatase